MAYQIKVWKNRLSEFPNRRRLETTGIENTYDVVRAEGNVTETGNAFDESEMNDLETRISNGITEGSVIVATHTRVGTTNDLEVDPGAKNISFLATADISDGDVWTVNGTSVTALLQNAEAIPGDFFKSGCWVTGVRLSDDGTKLFFRSRGLLTPLIFGDGRDGILNITSNLALTITGDYATRDLNYVEKQYKSVYIGANATLYPSDNNMGMVIRVKGDCIIDGTISNTLAGRRRLKTDSNLPFFKSIVCGSGGSGGWGGQNVQSSSSSFYQPGGNGSSGGSQSGGLTNYVGGGAYGGGAGSGASIGQYADQSNNGYSGGGTNGLTSSVSRTDLFKAGVGPYNNTSGRNGGGASGAITDRGTPAYTGDGAGNSGADGQYLGYRYHYGGGSGAAGGMGGGIILLLVGGNLVVNGKIIVSGGNGGKGGNGAFPESGNASGSGGGGGGGGGGAIWILYRKSYNNTGLLNVNGGNGGNRGNGANSWNLGTSGTSGGIGTISLNKYKRGDYYFGTKG